jgi:hypothetical protein
MGARTRLAVVAAAGAIVTAAALSSATTPPSAHAMPNPHAVPAGYKRVVDDTGTISVAVPESWTYIDTAPDEFGDGARYPTISASPALGETMCSECSPMPQLPELHFWVEPYRESALEGYCGDPGAVPFDNGRFTGYRINDTGCDAAVDEVHAHHVSGALTAHLSFIYWSAGPRPDGIQPVGGMDNSRQTFDVILGSFDWTGSPIPDLGPSQPPPPTQGNLPPAIVDPSDSLYFYGEFWSVPRLGREPVRGSGCGSQGQIGDTIPDGLWAGFVTDLDVTGSGGAVGIDLLCIFFGESAQAVRDEGTANIINDEADYLVVNNATRVRSLPTPPSMVLRESFESADGSCTEATPGSFVEPGPRPDIQAWIRVHEGHVTWVLWGCGLGSGPSQPPSTGNLPPAFPDLNASPPSVWPYGEFWNVPQLGTEPVRGSGCGASGQIGATIPDGLWAGFISYDGPTDVFWIDLLCIFYGESAQAVIADGTANIVSREPDYLIVNNNEQRRRAPNNVQVVANSWLDDGGRCVEYGWTAAGPDQSHFAPAASMFDTQAWIRIHDGAVTWILWGCDTGWTPGG